MSAKNIKGYAFEWFVRAILNYSGFSSVKPDSRIIFKSGRNMMIHGLGQPHNTDVLVNPPVQIPFFFPSRLIVECKCKNSALGIEHARNVLGLREDVNGFDIVAPDILNARRNYRRVKAAAYDFDRYHYQVALASTSGFKLTVQEFAAVHRIPLLQFRSAIFSAVVQLIYDLDDLSLSSNDKQILLNGFTSEDDIKYIAQDCSSEVRTWAEDFSDACLSIAQRMNIGILDNGSILFLYRPEYPDINNELNYHDGYSLHWSQKKYWSLNINNKEKYCFELPFELMDIWANKYKENMKAAARRLKEDYLKSIAVYTKDHVGNPKIEILTLSPTFMNSKLREYRSTENQK